jgi:hypothetical protein
MPSIRGDLIGCLWRLAALSNLILIAPTASASVETTLNWYGTRGRESQKHWLVGDASCAFGAEDCNRCAPGVEQQWADLNAGALSWREQSWHFGWERAVAPSNYRPEQVWDAGALQYPLTWPDEFKYHSQGFVRTNNPTIKYAMSHSDTLDGSLTFINSSRNVHAIHLTASAHPSGIFTLGQFVGLVDGTDVVRFFDTRRSLETHVLRYTMSSQTAGGRGVASANGGIAMAKLFRGGHLVVVGQGGEDTPAQETYFFFTDGNTVIAPNRLHYLGAAPYTGPSPNSAGKSENISLITECDTGQLYTVHVSGDGPTGDDGWYRLSKVVWGSKAPALQVIGIKWVNQHYDY